MHYYCLFTQPVPVKPYHNFKVIVPNDIFSIASAKAYFARECKTVKAHSLTTYTVLTIRTASEIQESILGASVESI